MASFNARQRDPLLDQNTQALVEKRGKELLGLLLIALGGVLAAMLWTYAPDDPGWMVASDHPASNMFGRLGATVSSTLIIILGLGAWTLPLLLGVWGGRFVLHRGQERVMTRAIFGWSLVIVASAFASTHVPGDIWVHSFGLGGLFGDTLLGMLVGGLPEGVVGAGLKISSFVLGLATLAAAAFTLGFDRAELQTIWRFLLVGAVVLYSWLLAGLRLLGLNAAHKAADLGQRLRDRNAAKAAMPEVVSAPNARISAPAFAQPAAPSLAAEPRAADATRSLRARVEGLIRRAPEPEPEPELIEPFPQSGDIQAPSEDRIRSRISEAISAKSRAVVNAVANGRAEPPVKRAGRPDVEIAPAVSRAVAAAQARAAAGIVTRVAPNNPQAQAPRLVAERGGHAEKFTYVDPLAEELLIETPLADALPPEGYDEGYDAYDLRYDLSDDMDGSDDEAWAMTAAQRHAADLEGEDEEDEIERALNARVASAQASAPAQIHRGSAANLAPRTPEPSLDVDDYADFGEEDEDDSFDAWREQPSPAPVRAPMVAPSINRGGPAAPIAAKPVPPMRAPVAAAQPPVTRQPRHEERNSPAYEAPPLALLTNPELIERHHLSDEALEENARMLENVLDDYGVKGEIVSVRPGPVVTMYELEPAPGLKASRVIGLADDIARSMSALSARVSTVPGRSVIGIELPNSYREKVVLREIITARDFADQNMRLPLALGKDIGGEPIIANLAKMPHLLIAGTTGSGKSVAINTMILSLLYKLTPEECRLIMIDPKMLELSVYDGIPHLLSPVVTDPKKAVVALKWVVGEMEERYRKMSKMGVRNIEGYNGRVREALAKGEMFKRTIQTGFDEETGDPVFETDEFEPQPFPYIVVIVDEMADLMMVAGKEIEACIQRLAQMARASGIHLIMATQRPSVDVITGTIKANFPTRISFQVTSKIDSRTILGEMGAEQLLGMGDMLYMAGGGRISRIHGPFVSDEEVEEIVTHLKSFGPPSYMSGVVDGPDEEKADDIDQILGLGGGENSEDALYDQAVAIVARDRKCSTSYIQRKLGIGYQKAARLVEQMEDNGVVSTANHVGKREILLPEH